MRSLMLNLRRLSTVKDEIGKRNEQEADPNYKDELVPPLISRRRSFIMQEHRYAAYFTVQLRPIVPAHTGLHQTQINSKS